MYKRDIKHGWASRFVRKPFTTLYYTFGIPHLLWATVVNMAMYNTPILTGNDALGIYGPLLLLLPVCYIADRMADKELE